MQCKRISLAALVLLVLLPAATWAHDFWIEPAKFRAAAGEKVPLKLFVGQHFKGESVLYLPELFERYVQVTGDGERPVAGERGDDPAGAITAAPGLNIVAYRSHKFDVSFDSLAEFEKYLTLEGLERNLQLASKRWKIRSSIVEIYSRCAKSLINVGPASATATDRVLGLPLELVTHTNPYTATDHVINLQLLYLGRPLEGGLVVAFNKADPETKIKQRTDKDGRVTLKLERRGTWLVTSVHMIPAPVLGRADWESFWASVTFEL